MITHLGHLYMMGANHKNQLGFDSNGQSVGSPSLVEPLKHLNALQVACGLDTTLVIAS